MDEMPDVLKKIIARKEVEVDNIRDDVDRMWAYHALQPFFEAKTPDFYDAITAEGTNIIAEHKKNSPSNIRKGNPPFRPNSTPYQVGRAYAIGNAAAISCLTDIGFEGKIEHMSEVRKGVLSADKDLPILRKDFNIHEIQLYEARYYGAGCVLLITAVLDDYRLRDMIQTSRSLGLDVLVESHTEAELERTIKAAEGEKIIYGVNNRNLHTFEEDIGTITRVLEHHQDLYPVIAESAIRTHRDIQIIHDANPNVTAYLVGTTLMKAQDQVRELEGLQV